MSRLTDKQKAQKLLKLFGPRGKHWCKGTYAMNEKTGLFCAPTDPTATKWCLVGACMKFGFSENFLSKHLKCFWCYDLFRSAPLFSVRDWPTEFNDRNGFTPVRKFLEKIIKKGA